MPLSELFGNPAAKCAIERMVASHAVPSTLLFSGPDGVGKSRFAYALASLLMGPKSEAKLKAHGHPDLHLLQPTGKSALYTIESIRKLIDEAALPPYEAPVKVFILEEAHQMLPTSSNALLKVLEEPFSHSYFILLTTAPDQMLPTLLSRCRKIPFFPLRQSEIEQVVHELWKKPASEARRIAFLSHGSLGKAQQIAEHPKLSAKEDLITLLSLQQPQDYPQLVRILTTIETRLLSDSDTEESSSSFLPQLDLLLEDVVMWYRDLHLLKEGMATEYLYHLDHLDALKLSLQQPIPSLETVLEQVSITRLSLQRHISVRSALEHFFLNLRPLCF